MDKDHFFLQIELLLALEKHLALSGLLSRRFKTKIIPSQRQTQFSLFSSGQFCLPSDP
jgi:hypothetical protein